MVPDEYRYNAVCHSFIDPFTQIHLRPRDSKFLALDASKMYAHGYSEMTEEAPHRSLTVHDILRSYTPQLILHHHHLLFDPTTDSASSVILLPKP